MTINISIIEILHHSKHNFSNQSNSIIISQSNVLRHQMTDHLLLQTHVQTISETSFIEYEQNILQSDTKQNVLQFQNPQSQQDNVRHNQQKDTSQNLQDFSDTDTIQNVSELSDIKTNNPKSITATNDSHVLQVPVRKVTQITNDDITRNPNEYLTQNSTSILSTSNTIITQPLRTQQISPRNSDRPPPPSQSSIYTTPQNSYQQGYSNPNATTTFQTQLEVQSQTTTLTRQPTLQTLSHTPARNTQTQNIQPFTINTLHSNTETTSIPSRTFARAPLKIIPNIPLSYNNPLS